MNGSVETSTFNMDNPRMRSQVLATVSVPAAIQWFAITFLFVATGVLFEKSIAPSERTAYNLVMFVVAPLYFGATYGLRVRKTLQSTFQRIRSVPGIGLLRAKFYPDRFEYESEAGLSAKMPYSVIFRVSPEKKGIMVVVDQTRMIWVPREAFFSEEDFQDASRMCGDAQLAKAQSQQLRGL